MQQLMLDTLVAAISGAKATHGPVIEAVRRTLEDERLAAAFIAAAVLLPTEAFIGDQMLVVDPEAIPAAREALRADPGEELRALRRDADGATAAHRFEPSPPPKGARPRQT